MAASSFYVSLSLFIRLAVSILLWSFSLFLATLEAFESSPREHFSLLFNSISHPRFSPFRAFLLLFSVLPRPYVLPPPSRSPTACRESDQRVQFIKFQPGPVPRIAIQKFLWFCFVLARDAALMTARFAEGILERMGERRGDVKRRVYLAAAGTTC